MRNAFRAVTSTPLLRAAPPVRRGWKGATCRMKTFPFRGLRWLQFLLLGGWACACSSPTPPPSVVGPYWDLVAQEPVAPAAYPLVVHGRARYCVRFTPDSVYTYANASAREVVDIAPHAGDYLYSYRFTRRNDSLFFGGRAYRVASLSRDSLVLSHGASRWVYTAAREQQKVQRKLKK